METEGDKKRLPDFVPMGQAAGCDLHPLDMWLNAAKNLRDSGRAEARCKLKLAPHSLKKVNGDGQVSGDWQVNGVGQVWGIGQVLHGLVLCALLVGCSKPKPLEVLSSVPEFTLTDQAGREFPSSKLKGKIWVANFIFTNCMGPCPRMTGQMKQVQNAVYALNDVRLISFTVDPARDTPEVLADYAKRNKAGTDQWSFLTGPLETLHNLKRHAFLLGDVTGQLDHSTRFALVDRRGRIRAFYDTTEDGAIKRVIRDVRALRGEQN